MNRSVKIALIAFIDDPLDPPGHERFGGGQSFCYDLIRYLVCRGDKVDVVTRLNDESKERYEEIGFNLRIHRVAVGPPIEVDPPMLAAYRAELFQETTRVLSSAVAELDVIHSQYWISGDVARRIAEPRSLRHVHHPLSFQREKLMQGDERTAISVVREEAEIAIFASIDTLIVLTPAESTTFRTLYPECAGTRIAIIPHGADYGIFFPRPESPRDYVRRAAERLEKGFRDAPGRA